MPLQPFTPAGVTAKTTELYALSTSLLNAQADLVEADFKDWIKDNFSLTAAQITYVTGINDHAAKYFGAQCSVAFRAKLTITLSVGVEPIDPANKWVVSQDSLITSTNSAGALETIGSLTFKVEYRS
ncbi:hypothetical protein FMM05_20555 [Flavobacterium zepuense]|uniref:Uncharacterized protein n=1 Tax=Flavobacterium zepuense TaxID=2593302 RepID=A0A552US76_9FLAO|nr:hypothetical protein [Flavobacterium zepuense]TRW21082.1 hypothetical protein FMM05_20555 [Flavobacterium zepuense]